MYQLILASQSPRRRELLEQAGFLFTTDSIKVSEIIDENLNPEKVAEGLAQLKAEAYLDQHKPLKTQANLLLTADTIVVLENSVLGKPANEMQATKYLSLLSGREHRVISAVCIHALDSGRWVVDHDVTRVQFRQLSDSDIKNYIATGEPMDKAGAYAIQGLGRKFVERYVGSWTNVVGLPMELFERLLNENDWVVDRK